MPKQSLLRLCDARTLRAPLYSAFYSEYTHAIDIDRAIHPASEAKTFGADIPTFYPFTITHRKREGFG